MKRAWIGLLFVAGCASPPELMPMEVGTGWTYTVRSGFETFVEPVTVKRAVPVAGVEGVEIGGPLGMSRIGWRKGVLFSDGMSNARFQPPIPLLDSSLKDRSWTGNLESMGKVQRKCTATLIHEPERLAVAGRKIDTTLATLSIKTPRTVIEVKTWYQPKVGIVQQEQRTAGKLDVAIQLLRGPS